MVSVLLSELQTDTVKDQVRISTNNRCLNGKQTSVVLENMLLFFSPNCRPTRSRIKRGSAPAIADVRKVAIKKYHRTGLLDEQTSKTHNFFPSAPISSLVARPHRKPLREEQLRKREKNTPQNPERQSFEMLEESFSSKSRKKDLSQKTFEE
jgi:hypothetical protein